MTWKFTSVLCLAAGLVVPVCAAGAKEDSARPDQAVTNGAATGHSGTTGRNVTPQTDDGFPANAGTGIAAIRQATKDNKYLLVMFYRTEDNQTRSMRQVLDRVAKKASSKAESVSINATDPQEKPIVTKLDVSRAPMPLVLVVAPNGAITGGFPKQVEESKLTGAMVGPSAAACLKALQDKKYVMLCLQNKSTQSNEAAMEGVNAFKADAQYNKTTEIVTADPTDTAEAKFFKDLQVDTKAKTATTVFLAPPGSVVGRFVGSTTKAALAAALEKAKSGAGCSGGKGCCPGK